MTLAWLGCGSKDKTHPPGKADDAQATTKSPAVDQASSCKKRVAALASRLEPLTKDDRVDVIPAKNLTPIVSPAGRVIDAPGPVVYLGGDGTVRFQHKLIGLASKPVELATAFRAEMTKEWAKIEAALKSRKLTDVPSVYVWAGQKAPAAVLPKLVAALPGRLSARLLVARPKQPAVKPLPSASAASVKQLFAKLEGSKPGPGAMLLAEAVNRAIGSSCAPLVKVLGKLATTARRDKVRLVATKVPAAIGQCQCKLADLDLMEQVLLRVSGAYDPPQAWFPLKLETSAKTRVALPKDATVAGLVAALEKLPAKALAGPIAIDIATR